MKKLLVFASLLLLFSCGQVQSSEDISTSSSSEEIDYGTVEFSSIYVYKNDYDGVKIQPLFSNPISCENVEFTYVVEDESICEIDEDNCVYYLSKGNTKVTATSEYFEEATFYVYAVESYPRSSNFYSKRNEVTNNVNENTTLFLGDSFFEFWKNGTNKVKTLAEEFPDYDICNIGISATTSHEWRAAYNKILSSMDSPKNIVVNIGINNVDDMYETGYECARNVEALLLDLTTYFPESNIYYFSITRCSGVFAKNWTAHQISNNLVKSFIDKYEKMNYLDVMSLYGDDYASCEADGLHPNQKGYDYFKQLLNENVTFVEK